MTKNNVSKKYTLSNGDYVPSAHDFIVVPGYESGVKQVYVTDSNNIYVLHLSGKVSHFNNYSFQPVFLQGTNFILNADQTVVYTSLSNIDALIDISETMGGPEKL